MQKKWKFAKKFVQNVEFFLSSGDFPSLMFRVGCKKFMWIVNTCREAGSLLLLFHLDGQVIDGDDTPRTLRM
jgi:hypothetical protein